MLKISFRSRTHNLRCGRNDGKVHNFQGDKKIKMTQFCSNRFILLVDKLNKLVRVKKVFKMLFSGSKVITVEETLIINGLLSFSHTIR